MLGWSLFSALLSVFYKAAVPIKRQSKYWLELAPWHW